MAKKRQPCELCGNNIGYPYTITANEGLAVIDLCDTCKATNTITAVQEATMSGKGTWVPRKGRPRRSMRDIRYE